MHVGKSWHDRFTTPINALSRRVARQQLGSGANSSDAIPFNGNSSVIMHRTLLVHCDNRGVVNDGLHSRHFLRTTAALWSQTRWMAQVPGGKALIGARHRQDGILVVGSPHELDARRQALVRKTIGDSDGR